MVKENSLRLLEKIAEKCIKQRIEPEKVTLIAVSKTYGVNEISEAFSAGIKNFGENKAQELAKKIDLISLPVTWHFIGHLQTNKVKYVIKSAEFIHSVDSIKLAAEIEKYASLNNKLQKVLLEIKTSNEATKFGLTDRNEIAELAAFCVEAKHLELKGLMTIAPYTEDERVIRNSFRSLFNIKTDLEKEGFSLEHLSMGMTHDWEIALEEGATMLRIGTAIFGERIYN